jgi:hypothetical protein
MKTLLASVAVGLLVLGSFAGNAGAQVPGKNNHPVKPFSKDHSPPHKPAGIGNGHPHKKPHHPIKPIHKGLFGGKGFKK